MFGSKRIFLQQEEKKQEIVVVLQKPKESESEPPISNRKEVFGWKTPVQTRELLREISRKIFMKIKESSTIDSFFGPTETHYLLTILAKMEDMIPLPKKLQTLMLETIEKKSDEYKFTEEEKTLVLNYISGYPNVIEKVTSETESSETMNLIQPKHSYADET